MSPDYKAPRVYVVDDETVIVTTLGTILQMKGFEAHAFDQPLEALQAARVLPPDLLISDVMMPLITGIELALQMRALCPNCKVLLFSGQAVTADLLAEARVTGHHFEALTKPIYPADLLKKIDDVFAN